MSTTCAVPRRKKADADRGRLYPRLNVEVYPDELETVRRARMLALARGETMQALVLRALAAEVERLERKDRGAP